MTREELISYCRYYKGEESNPYESETPQSFFWRMEREYINGCIIGNGKMSENHEKYVQNYIEEHPNEKNIYTDKNVSIHTKGMALYIEMMSEKWIPYVPNMVFSY